MSESLRCTILIVEDGDEYLTSLSSFVVGPQYLQAQSGDAALQALRAHEVDLIYLDMRFDRIEPSALVGDLQALVESHNGDRSRALKHLQDHQGLYVLDHLARHGYAHVPVILACDFGREPRRFEHLSRRYPKLTWVHDSVSADEIRARIGRLLSA